MISLTIADEIQATLLDYLTTTFNFQDPAVEEALLDFLTGPQGMFRGPYVHQLRAFERLTSRYDPAPQPTTIITTGASGASRRFCSTR